MHSASNLHFFDVSIIDSLFVSRAREEEASRKAEEVEKLNAARDGRRGSVFSSTEIVEKSKACILL